jgi:hypothetical protein
MPGIAGSNHIFVPEVIMLDQSVMIAVEMFVAMQKGEKGIGVIKPKSAQNQHQKEIHRIHIQQH